MPPFVRGRCVMFTVFEEPEEFFDHWETCDMPKEVVYLAYQLELCPETNRLHIQGYAEFDSALRLKAIKELFGRESMHIDLRKGTQKQAIDYVTKAASRERGPVQRGKAKEQGRRLDLEGLANRMRAGERLVDIAMSDPVAIVRHHRGLQALEMYYNQPKPRGKPKIIFMWGAPGCGKSRLAHAIYPEAYVAPDKKEGWFDGYIGQEEVIFDDFKGSFPYGDMLKLLDRYAHRQNIKGTFASVKCKRFIFTANEPPSAFYDGHPAWMDRILNRFGEVWDEDKVKAECEARGWVANDDNEEEEEQ